MEARENQHNIVDLNLSVTSRPPSGKTDIVCNSGFQYRGRLFSASRQRTSPESAPSSALKRHSDKPRDIDTSNQSLNQVLSSQNVLLQTQRSRKIQSATGRLERHKNREKFNRSTLPPSQTFTGLGEKRPSVVNLDINDIPDCEEENLLRIASVRENADKNRDRFLSATAIRPSSAKGTIGSPVVKSEEPSSTPDATEKIKPSVFGLKIGRQVYGGGPEVIEAWKQKIDNNFPYKLSSDDKGVRDRQLVLKNERPIPSTLQPIKRWCQDSVPSHITGVKPSTCLIFLLHDYQDVQLPVVPMPQDPTEDLPYNSIVETPRQNIIKRYDHPFFEKDFSQDDWKCKHNEGVVYPGAISPYRCTYVPRSSEKVRKEISELDDLLKGIGSLTSNCSFVQFQAEIDRAKDLAAKLSLLKPRESEEERDTFGLLKLYRDHEKIIAKLHQRRNECLQELSLLEQS